jgi:proton-dependent oligopeptide transporter, POT family
MNPAYKLMLIAWVAVAAWVAIVIYTNRKVHPRALFALFMVELWERFSYYGMRALLVLYMASELIRGGFGFADAKAYGIYAAYGALVYLTPIIGGYFADKMMGFRKAILWGSILMAAGQFTLFLNDQFTFYIGLALLVVGNGFFKPNISSMIGKFYKTGDARRDGAFSIFYMGINIGAFLTPLTCGAIGEIEGWKYGFLAAGIGMVVGLLIFMWAKAKGWLETNVDEAGQEMTSYRPIGLEPTEVQNVAGINGKWVPYLATVVLVAASWLLIKNDGIVDIILALIGTSVIVYMLVLSGKYERFQQQRIWVILLLLFFTTVFWTFFELAGSALNLFTDRNVNKTMLGTELTTTFFQSINPLFIMIFAPIFSWLWIKLGQSGREPSAPYKFGTGLVLLGLGFLVLNVGKGLAIAGLVPAIFLILLYMLHTLGELTISPVGLSLVTKLAPSHIVGFLMGIWFLSSSIAHQAGKYVAQLTAVDESAIVQGESFKACYTDERLEFAMITQADTIKKYGLENTLVSDQFIQALNASPGDAPYYKATVQIKEAKEKAMKLKKGIQQEQALEASFLSFLTQDAALAGESKEMTKAEARSLFETSSTNGVISCLKNDSLKLSLSVFRLLGFIAIGCGLLLYLLGPMVSRWMHGIK